MAVNGREIKTATVTEVEDLSPRLRRIRLSDASLVGVDFTGGDKIKIEAGPKFKSYTPGRVNTEAGWMDVVFYLHGNGLASQWAGQATPGESINYLGPVKSVPGPQKTPEWALFLGDETTIGLAKALIDDLPDSTRVMGAIELDTPDVPSVAAFGVDLDTVIRREFCGEALVDWVNAWTMPEGQGMIWVSGEALAARALGRMFADRDRERVEVKTKAYWSSKGHAHRKLLEKDGTAAK